jgi:hypothetical protein
MPLWWYSLDFLRRSVIKDLLTQSEWVYYWKVIYKSIRQNNYKGVWLIAKATNITTQIKNFKKGHTPSIITVNIAVYLKENGNKKNKK